MGISYSDREEHLLRTLRPYLTLSSIQTIFEALGYERTLKGLERKCSALRLKYEGLDLDLSKLTPDLLTEEEAKVVQEYSNYTIVECDEERTERVKLKSALADQLAAVAEMADKHFTRLLEEHRTKKPPARVRLRKKGQSFCLVLSDLHIGHKQNAIPETSQEAFSFEVAERRMHDVVERASTIIEGQIGSNLDSIYILVGGDTVDGEHITYFQHKYHIEDAAIHQAFKAIELISYVITTLHDRFKVPVIVYTVRGNHGRTKEGHEHSSWDVVVGRVLELLYSRDRKRKVVVHHSPEEVQQIKIRDHCGLLRHEAPANIGTAASKAKLGGWLSHYNFSFLVSGHFHQPSVAYYNGRPILRNGALYSGGPYPESLALFDEAAQIYFISDDEEAVAHVGVIRWRREGSQR